MAVNKYLGPTGLTELINLIQNRFSKKQDWMQFPEMPSAAEYVGKVVQYTGTTDNDFTKGYFYYSNGISWAQVNVMSAVVICKDSLPDWGLADPGLIYFVTSENKAYVRNNESEGEWYDLTNGEGAGPFIIVTALPLWSDADPNKIYLLVESDGTSVTGYVKSSTIGKYYQLGGGSVKGFELVVTLPAYTDADPDVLYLVINGTKLAGYVKNVNEAGEFYELGAAAEPAFEIVDALPAWASASVDKIYFLKDSSKLFGYIKNEAGGWFMFGSSGGIEQVTVLPDWAAADPDILYLVPDENDLLSAYKKDPNTTGKFFELSGNDAITMEDIEDIFDEVFGD